MESLVGPIVENLVAGLLGSAIVFVGGFLVGRYRERRRVRVRNLEDYDFYPFAVDRGNFPQFDLAAFRRGVTHLLQHPDANAPERIEEFLAKYLRIEMQLGENILSREEYALAVAGKRHWLDEPRLAGRHA